MYYTIRHITRFRYTSAITESVMEVRMRPRSEGPQQCLHFTLAVSPRARVLSYQDHMANAVHHFDVPSPHPRLTITADALVELRPFPELPEALGLDAWDRIDEMNAADDHWDMLMPSTFAKPTPLLNSLFGELGLTRNEDPLTLLRRLTSQLFQIFTYRPQSTRVDSPIDEVLTTREGVCQDYAHVMIALVRGLRLPCRYVSGYLAPRPGGEQIDRSAADATHAWVEALLPDLGWVGFDPTNDLIAGDRHIRAAVGRDYADVPPTRGVFKGTADTELSVAVTVIPAEQANQSTDDLDAAYTRVSSNWTQMDTETEDQDRDAQEQQQQ